MRRLQGLVTLVVVAAGCNEVLGLHAGRPLADETGGSSGSVGVGGAAASGAAGSPMRGGSSSNTGGDAGGDGESGTSAGGTGGTRGGRGGAGGGSSGDGGGPGGGGAGGREACTSSRACRDLALGYDFCVKGECTRITSTECDTIFGDEWVGGDAGVEGVEEDPEAEPYFFGALAPFDSTQTTPLYWNLKLAMREFSAHGRINIAGEERRPVLFLCRSPFGEGFLDPLQNGLDQMFRVGVSSVLMLIDSRSDLQTLAERTVTQPEKDVFFLDVGGALYGTLDFGDYGRLWHMLGDTYSLGFPFVPLVERIEELVNPGAATGNAAELTRLVVVTGTNDAYDRELAERFTNFTFSPLRINGMPMHRQTAQVGRVVQGNQQGFDDAVAEFAPHIVLDFSGDPGLQPVVEDAFLRRGFPPPFYILPPGRVRFQAPASGIGSIESLEQRVVGLYFASAEDPTLYQAYLERLDSLGVMIRSLGNFANAYDAVYYLIYSAIAGGGGGSAQAVGFRRLLLGPRRNLGPDGIASVLARLASSPDATLSLSGASGDFNFHSPTGGRIAFANTWCMTENLEYVMDDLRYDHASGSLTGTPSCWDP